MDINDFLNTAHISVCDVTLKIVVNDIKKFDSLLNPELTPTSEEDVYEVSEEWEDRMKIPDFVLTISHSIEDDNLYAWCTYPYDIAELAEWIKKIESGEIK